ncbi:MAG: hypothetical protein ABH873_02115, partial [Candidatus Firestonebacteria bacterium]
MYIRELKIKKNNMLYKYYKLVETFSTSSGPRQRDILILKNFKVAKKDWKDIVSLIHNKIQGQESLVQAKEELIKIAEEITNKIRLKE